MHTKSCVDLWEGDLSQVKVYESSLTLCNHFLQPYRALDTLFPEKILLTLANTVIMQMVNVI